MFFISQSFSLKINKNGLACNLVLISFFRVLLSSVYKSIRLVEPNAIKENSFSLYKMKHSVRLMSLIVALISIVVVVVLISIVRVLLTSVYKLM